MDNIPIPNPDEIAILESSWSQIWHPRFKHLDTSDYIMFKSLILEAVFFGICYQKASILDSLEKSLCDDSPDVI